MALRHLVTGQNNCAPDGASSSNPLNALANAFLGQSSKAQSIKELPGSVSVPSTSDFSAPAPLSNIPGAENEFKQDQRPLARGADFIRGGPANDWIESFWPPGVPELGGVEAQFQDFEQIYNNTGTTFRPPLDVSMAGVPAYHSTDPCTDDGEHSGHPAVPDAGTGISVVDFDTLVNGAAEQRAQAVRDVGRACQNWGFFMVVNHGVPEDLKEAFMEACEELFSSASEDKAAYLEAGPMAPVRVGSGFYAAVDGARYWRDYFKMFAHPELHCPAKTAKLREVAAEYAATTRRLLLSLATAVSESLGLAAGRVSEALRLDSCFQILVANRYPPCYDAAGPGLGMPAHSDHGFLTLLFQNGVDGLQVHHGGRWLLARPLPGAFFVIAGDQLEIVSNGRYKGVLHRAVVGGERARMSVVSMISPCLDTVVEPVPELAADGQGLLFRGVRYRDYMEHQQSNKLDGKAALDIARVQRVVTAPEN